MGYFGRIERPNGVEKMVAEDTVLGKREKGQRRCGWIQKVTEVLNMLLRDVSQLVQGCIAFRGAVRWTMFWKEDVT